MRAYAGADLTPLKRAVLGSITVNQHVPVKPRTSFQRRAITDTNSGRGYAHRLGGVDEGLEDAAFETADASSDGDGETADE